MARDQQLSPSRRALLAGLGAAFAPLASARAETALFGRPRQGGFLIGRTAPRTRLWLDGEEIGAASRHGLFFIGFDRDAPPQALLKVGAAAPEPVVVAPGVFDIQKIDGLPSDQVAPSDPALLARIQAEAKRKAAGFASRIDDDGFRSGFVFPLDDFRLSAAFGGQRILNGVPKRPHYGADLAAPVGTPVRAPAAGKVVFAETGLHFEGGLILIDHGQGLISAYLHLSRIKVRPGARVWPGQVIGAVGKEGRATGPHLCWRLKWRGRNLDPLLLTHLGSPLRQIFSL